MKFVVLCLSIRALVIISRGDDTPLEASPSHYFGAWHAVSERLGELGV